MVPWKEFVQELISLVTRGVWHSESAAGNPRVSATYRERRYMTCGRNASAVGIESDERDLGSHPTTIHGSSRSGRDWFNRVADTAD